MSQQKLKRPVDVKQSERWSYISRAVNPSKPEFYVVIFIHYKPRIAVAILDL